MKEFTEFNLRDSFIFYVKELEQYLLTATTFPEGLANKEPAFHYYISKDLEKWEGPTLLFEPKEDFWGIRNYWAPEIHQYDDNYYLIGSFKGKIGTKRGCLILKSTSVYGPYEPITNKPITPEDVDCLDASFAIVNYQPWLFYSYEWTNDGHGKIFGQQLSQDLASTVNNPIEIVNTEDCPWIRQFIDPRVNLSGYLTDAPCYLYRNDQHHIIWSSYGKTEDGYQGGYTINITRARELNGPWTPSKVILDKNIVHASLFTHPSGEQFICAHNNDTLHGNEHPVIFKLKDIIFNQ